MDTLRLGVVGSGGMATRRAERFAALDDTEVKTIAARNPETGPALARAVGAECVDDWQALIADDGIDAVVVATHNELHGPIVIAALEAGKHVFAEYPTARHPEENARIAGLIASPGSPALRLSNNESVSAEHAALKARVGTMGHLLDSHFLRLTPGRGKRPEVLFNLQLSGPPALFFVYHVHGYVSLFGPAAWVHATAQFDGLRDDGGYERFSTSVAVGFEGGGTGHWTWAGGVEIESAIQEARIVMRDGTLIETETGWDVSTPAGTEPLAFGENARTLEALFLADTRGETDWRPDAVVGIEAARIGHAAERSAEAGRVVRCNEV